MKLSVALAGAALIVGCTSGPSDYTLMANLDSEYLSVEVVAAPDSAESLFGGAGPRLQTYGLRFDASEDLTVVLPGGSAELVGPEARVARLASRSCAWQKSSLQRDVRLSCEEAEIYVHLEAGQAHVEPIAVDGPIEGETPLTIGTYVGSAGLEIRIGLPERGLGTLEPVDIEYELLAE